MIATTPTDRPTGVLFDVDGTLVDSNYLHIAAWACAFHELGRPVESWRVHRALGMDSDLLLQELLGDDADRLGGEAKRLHARAYSATTSLLSPLPGAQALIRELAERDIRVVLATSAPADELATLRSVLDVDDAITAVTSADDVDTAKPDPDIVRIAQQRSGCAVADLHFVGDSVWDMRAARRAGLTSIGVLSGGIGAGELRAAGAHQVHTGVDALLSEVGLLTFSANRRGRFDGQVSE